MSNSEKTIETNEPIGFTYLVTYALDSGLTGKYEYGHVVVDDVVAWINQEPRRVVYILNVLQITTEQAKGLES